MARVGQSGDHDKYLPLPKGFATAAIHHHQEAEQWNSMAVVTPIVTSTTFKQYGPANFKKYEYGRSGNPTREVLENLLAKLDGVNYGLTFSSGLGALTVLAGLFESGDNFIIGDDVYGGTNRLFNKVFSKFNIEITLVDLVDLKNLENAIKPNTKLIWLETPTNPTLKVIDIKKASEIAKRNNILLAVDNTFLTPYLQRPIELGADLAVYSLTKYMNGHSDVIMGSMVTNDKELYDKLKYLQNAMGVVPAPFDCYQVTRSLKTLALRMQQHKFNGITVAEYLEAHPMVEKVLHPGLESHPQHELFKRQTSGHSGIFSFYLKGDLKKSETFLSALQVFTLAESLGGYESLAELPSVMTHASVDSDLRARLGITDNLIRLSVGLEDVEDLIDDLEQAFQKVKHSF
ncbi:cystathionine gamma-lyase [Diorhabda sublineata]|uniref:cystathionine gamma-lyase n=1 Tax=Diorhabda sublineata TaxID=1163346 RepID=UPI0024E1564B|nr:cystathionine gamma-lyase [Diorhabda sublineata]XP_056641351.1 cystathionine gamma-lyase [Diorhabda sublineata]XP_056641352.1 cystathionine gamma-lyase [Diorhabda sublineata]XP_056641353.1 cystathionine gamma-lyase [Diorhabda sublineata]XP_056641354.1 cystathionine gamma-lyase [Diorhabda sublineata]